MKKAPRFFCNHCGAEVASGIAVCPSCGRYFSSIRCPKCGFSGEEAEFLNGCPSCGYSSRQSRIRPSVKRSATKHHAFSAWLYIPVACLLVLLLSLLLFAVK